MKFGKLLDLEEANLVGGDENAAQTPTVPFVPVGLMDAYFDAPHLTEFS